MRFAGFFCTKLIFMSVLPTLAVAATDRAIGFTDVERLLLPSKCFANPTARAAVDDGNGRIML
jgi:hypothetical protein